MIILDRTRDAYSRLSEQCQCGFRPGMGCDDAIFTLRNVVERTGQSGILIFIDLTSAYDTLPRRLMFRLLSLRLGLPHFVELLRAVYTNTTAVIKGSKKSFKVPRGCRQPWVFIVVFNSVCRVIHRKVIDELGNGYGLQLDYQIPIEATDREQRSRFKSWGSTKSHRVMYADDLCACFTSVDAARRGLKIIENRELKILRRRGGNNDAKQ